MRILHYDIDDANRLNTFIALRDKHIVQQPRTRQEAENTLRTIDFDLAIIHDDESLARKVIAIQQPGLKILFVGSHNVPNAQFCLWEHWDVDNIPLIVGEALAGKRLWHV